MSRVMENNLFRILLSVGGVDGNKIYNLMGINRLGRKLKYSMRYRQVYQNLIFPGRYLVFEAPISPKRSSITQTLPSVSLDVTPIYPIIGNRSRIKFFAERCRFCKTYNSKVDNVVPLRIRPILQVRRAIDSFQQY